MKKIIIVLFVSILSLSIVGCENQASSENTSSNTKQSNQSEKTTDTSSEQNKKVENEIAKLSKWRTIKEIGQIKQIGFGYNDELGIDGSDNPNKPYKFGNFEFYITNMTAVLIKPNDKGSALFNSYQDQKAIIVNYKIVNKTNSKMDFETDNMEITTPDNDKLSPDGTLSTYFGINKIINPNETVNGTSWFVLNDNNKKLNKVLLYISGPQSLNVNENDYNGKTFNFNILNVKESVIKDLKK